MSSSVSYITNKKGISDKKALIDTSASLSFDLPDLKDKTILGSGTKPKEINKKVDYNYGTTGNIFNGITLSEIVKKMNDTVFIPNGVNVEQSFQTTVDKYNRFKVANPDLVLQKAFPHVFFVRPSCNLISSENGGSLLSSLESNELFHYTWKSSPSVVKELVKNNGQKHDFMLSLSNAVSNFSLNEEYINSDSYGRTYTGYKIAYGKHNIDSKTSGEFSVSFNDDRNLHIYQLHRLWVEYISGVYRGQISPTNENILNKILDYVGACYYFLTAEDGETIIFWSKYYGIFPTNVPAGQFSWSEGNVVNERKIDVNYKYSFKEDFNPYSILEFNYNARMSTNASKYVPIYDSALNHVGPTWVGTPFIELVKDTSTGTYVYKLRFCKASN